MTTITRLGAIILIVSVVAFGQRDREILTIAAAADLQFVMGDLTSAFEKQTGYKTRVVFGSSGNFAAQIRNGAPYDVFFSADMDYPGKLTQDGYLDSKSVIEYAVGRLALWVPKGSPLDPARGLTILLDPAVHKIAVANPGHAPYGRLAVTALRGANLYTQLAGRLVLGENVSQAAQFAATGNAQAALISLSLALSPGMREGKYWIVPDAAIEQGAGITRRGAAHPAAREFLTFVSSVQGQAILRQHGFVAPGERK